jgi:hypothetical protein
VLLIVIPLPAKILKLAAVPRGTVAGLVYTLKATVPVPKLTEPALANILPSNVALLPTEIDCSAIIVPLKTELAPRVAELPTCQKTLDASAPFMRTTLLLAAVVSVPEPAVVWKMKMSVAEPLSVRVPVISKDPEVDA